jgi:hypothetical protein
MLVLAPKLLATVLEQYVYVYVCLRPAYIQDTFLLLFTHSLTPIKPSQRVFQPREVLFIPSFPALGNPFWFFRVCPLLSYIS